MASQPDGPTLWTQDAGIVFVLLQCASSSLLSIQSLFHTALWHIKLQEARGKFHRADWHKIPKLLFYDVFHQGCFPLSLVSIKVNQLGAEGMLQQLSNMSNGWYEPYYHICYKYFSIIFNFSNRHSKSAAQPPRENTSDILLSATLNTSRYPAATTAVQQLQTLYISPADHSRGAWYTFKAPSVQK